MIREFIGLCEKYEPGFSQAIRGATGREIAQLERLAGRPMPAVYREFLESLGHGTGGFHTPDADYGIDLVLGFYKRHGKSWSQEYLFFGELGVEPAVDYYLEAGEPGGEDGRVVGFDRDQRPSHQKAWAYFPSLRDMLFWSAFNRLCIQRLPYRRTFTPRLLRKAESGEQDTATTLTAMSELATKMGFQRLAYTSQLNPMFERRDAALLGHQRPGGEGFSVELAAEKEIELRRMAEVFVDNLPVHSNPR